MKRIVIGMVAAGALLVGTVFADEPEGRVQTRKENQQGRIAQGVQSGSLTAGETSNLERKESNLNQEIHADRMANGGRLTNAEKAQVNRQQNRLSRKIYKDKHNAAHQVR